MLRTIALTGLAALIAATTTSLVPPAQAQIGNIFSDPPLRPPGAIPRGNQQQQPFPDDDEEVPELPRGRLLPTPNRPPPGQGAPPPGSFQSQPLAPPPGTTVAPQGTQPGVAVQPPQPGQPGVANAPPGQRQPPAKGVPSSPATLQPGDEVVSEPPATKITNKKASFSGLDKITGRIINFDEDIGETVQFGALRVKTSACYTRPSTEAANTDAFVEVDEITLQGEVKRIFSGWMYAASPGLHGVEHPVYDIWLTDCKGPDQTIVSAQPDPPKAARRRRPQSVRRSRSRRLRARRDRRRNRNSSRSRSRLLHRRLRRSNGRVDCLADCSGIKCEARARMDAQRNRDPFASENGSRICAALHPGHEPVAIIASASSPLMLACNRIKSAGSPAIALSSKAR